MWELLLTVVMVVTIDSGPPRHCRSRVPNCRWHLDVHHRTTFRQLRTVPCLGFGRQLRTSRGCHRRQHAAYERSDTLKRSIVACTTPIATPKLASQCGVAASELRASPCVSAASRVGMRACAGGGQAAAEGVFVLPPSVWRLQRRPSFFSGSGLRSKHYKQRNDEHGEGTLLHCWPHAANAQR